MDENIEVYDYDKCSFFRLLQTQKYRLKFEFVQQQQGLVVCPLKLTQLKANKRNELIDSHLFVPSPFYKNHYIPLNSLTALASLNTMCSSLPLDHSQQIHLFLNDDYCLNELCLINFRRRICRNVKLFSIQTAYADNFKKYKILIVNKQLRYKRPILLNFTQQRTLNPNGTLSIDKLAYINSENEDDFEEETKPTDSNNNSDQELSNDVSNTTKLITYITPDSPIANFTSLNDVKTYRQSIDFMQENHLTSTNKSENSDDEHSSQFKSIRLIGTDLLSELELFRKTYIILHTHLDDCSEQLIKIYSKYLNKFLKSIERYRLRSDIIDLMILIACENTIVGFLYTKLWPNILQLNYTEDQLISLKCKQLTHLLKLNSKLNEQTIMECSKFFNIDQKYFRLNTQPCLNELKRLSLFNIPFEKLDCIKMSIDLLTNELTISLANQKEQCVITSEILIPLFAFVLIKSSLNCFKSIIYFIDKFQLSAKQSVKSFNSTSLDELAYFMATFRAAIQFIETSQ